MGLVAFSFTLLGFGAVVYTAALPSMVQAAEETSGAFRWVLDNGGDALDPSTWARPGDDEGDGSAKGGRAGGARAGLSGVSTSVAAPVAPKSPDKAKQKQDEKEQGAQDPNAAGDDAGTDEKPGDDQGGSSQKPGDGDDSTQGGIDPDGPDPAEEQAFYEYLAGKYADVGGYVDYINAANQEFSANMFASKDVRRASAERCDLLYSQLYSDWGDLATHPVPDGSQYEPQRGELIGMYRCLASYMGCLGSAWQVNISIGDDAIESSVDEFMEPLRAEEVNGENRYITEFRSYYEGFAL